MLKNLNLTRVWVFSGQLYRPDSKRSFARPPYAWTQRNAMKVWDEGGEYRELVIEDADISSKLSPEEIARALDVKHYLRNVETVFKRVFD
ncbi:MAG: hypothetical protein IPJ30_08960 [Acidobacteria bacterium]|nr:hypothetical protein [Acidobacteriota bacterium]